MVPMSARLAESSAEVTLSVIDQVVATWNAKFGSHCFFMGVEAIAFRRYQSP
jgi:hypothetical protein